MKQITRQLPDAKVRSLLNNIESFQTPTDSTGHIIWNWDIAANRMVYNEGIKTMLGYEVGEIKNIDAWLKQNIHPDDFKKVCSRIDEIFKTKKQNSHITYRFKTAGDSYKFIYDNWFTIYDKYGKPERIVGVMEDLTLRKQAGAGIEKVRMEAQEQERLHIGSEIHDNVNQLLTGCLLNLAMIKVATPEKAIAIAETSRGYILSAIDELRKLTHRLVPVTSVTATLEEIFENLILSMNINPGFTINTHFDLPVNAVIADNILLHLYRILQEQLNNIVKHSGASLIDISVTVKAGDISLRIFDNGMGADNQLLKMGTGFSNIKKRIQILNGVFTLNASPGNGCELIARIPLCKKQ